MDRPEPDPRAWNALADKSDAGVPTSGRPAVADMSDAEFDRWMELLPPCPGLPSTTEEIAAADARAEADIIAGRAYPHSVVSAWLDTWGKPDRKPFREWLKSSG